MVSYSGPASKRSPTRSRSPINAAQDSSWPAPFGTLLLLKVGLGRGGRGSLWCAPLGHVPMGWADLVDPQAGLGQVWEAREGLWALVWAKSEDLSKIGLNP